MNQEAQQDRMKRPFLVRKWYRRARSTESRSLIKSTMDESWVRVIFRLDLYDGKSQGSNLRGLVRNESLTATLCHCRIAKKKKKRVFVLCYTSLAPHKIYKRKFKFFFCVFVSSFFFFFLYHCEASTGMAIWKSWLDPDIPSEERLENLRYYKYAATDKSLVSKYILRHYWNWAVTLFPTWMA